MGPLSRLYAGIGSAEPAPEDITRGENLADAMTGRPLLDAGALDELERAVRAAAPDAGSLGPDEIQVVAAAAVRHLAPLAHQDGVWLAPFAQAPYCHVAAGGRLARLGHAYRRPPGHEGRPARAVGELLRVLGQPSGAVGSRTYVDALRLDEAAYVLPDLLLAIGRSPHRYTAELLAAVEPTLTGALFELPEWISGCVAAVVAAHPGTASPLPSPLPADDVAQEVAAALKEFTECGLVTDGPRRFAGFGGLLRDALRLFRAELERSCLNVLLAPEHAMTDLVERKTPSARCAHGTAALDGTALDAYFDGSGGGTGDLLAALGRSPWIVPGDPGRSPFLTNLAVVPGPMGKIFSAEDIGVVRRWVTWLADPLPVTPLPAPALALPDLDRRLAESGPDAAGRDGLGAAEARELFHELVAGHDRGPAVRRAAAFVEYWLDEAQAMDKPVFTWELPERYEPDAFCGWMHKTYQDMACAPVSPVRDNGKAHRDRTFHGAADNLVDGAWLQGLSRRLVLGGSERLLHDIYWDEIGNGVAQHSHGVLYEDLLKGLGYRLPKFWTREFVDGVPFLDEGFLAPVFRLAVAEFPVSRLPETVGANMVCEFHGLGTAGISKADGLTDLGYDTSFTRLHIADDNVEMGHSAKSRDAVVLLMTEAGRLGVTDLVWERVRRGATAMRMAYVALMQGRLGIAPTQIPAHLLTTDGQ